MPPLRCIAPICRSDISATVGSSVRLNGTLVESRGKQEVELQVEEVAVLGESREEAKVPGASDEAN